MNLSMLVDAFGGVLLRNTLAGAVLICLVLTARSLFRNRISPQWMFWLWMLVILRFITPWSIPSPVSLLNLFEPAKASVAPLLERQALTVYRSPAETATTPTLLDMPLATPSPSSSTQNAAPESTLSLAMILAGVWAVGAGCVAIFILVQSLYFWVVIRREKQVIRQDVLEILEECKEQLGICTLLCIVQTRRIHTPALMGFIRPRLVFPEGLLDTLSTSQLRHILLHELSHLKRLDIMIGWAMAAVQVLHWFNPLVWVAARQMHRDRELACDADVLSAMDQRHVRDYGMTLLHLMETMSNRPLGIGLSGIMENKSFVRRRIEMIAFNRSGKKVWGLMLLAVTAAVLIAVTGSRDIAAAAEPNSIEPEVSGPLAIVKTSPEAFAKDVDPATTAITVTFNQKMRDGSWSWTGGGETYPEPVGSPSYLPDMKTCQRNVKLQPGKVYWIGVNSPSHKNFKNERGEPAPWYIILFATKDASGKPTPIPDDLLKRAQQINKAALAAATETSPGASAESGAPAIVKTVPEVLANDVNPASKFIAVTFDRKMRDGSWSWTGGGETYPELTGSPSYLPDMKTCRVNVKLEPGKVYCVGINSPSHRNFKSEAGVSAPWYILLFATKDAAGNPTPIPDDMLEEARKINAASGAKVIKSSPGKSYRVDRSVDQFEKDDDFSTPEAAYASINKLSSQNKINWKQVSAAELATKMKDEIAKTPADWGKVLAGAKILEVYQADEKAMVVAELPQALSAEKIVAPFDVRYFSSENGKWLNLGNDRFNSVDEAVSKWAKTISAAPAQKKAASKPSERAYDDGKSAGKSSIAGGAHAVKFEGEKDCQVLTVRIYGSRYGTPQPPQEKFKIVLADADNQTIEEMEFPYSVFKRGEPAWYTVKLPKPVDVPATFYVVVDFNPEQTKGVYVHYDAEASGHSFTGSTTDNVKPESFDKGDWMIRAMVLN